MYIMLACNSTITHNLVHGLVCWTHALMALGLKLTCIEIWYINVTDMQHISIVIDIR